MDFRESRWGRMLSAFVLFFFCWTFAGGAELAQAAGTPSSSQGEVHSAKKTAQSLDETLSGIESTLADESLSAKTKKDKAKEALLELEDADTALHAEFAATEAYIKKKGLGQGVLNRLSAFVAQYEENAAKTKSALEAVRDAKSDEDVKANAAEAVKHLLKVNPRKKNTLDPKALPHRLMEPTTTEPVEEGFNTSSFIDGGIMDAVKSAARTVGDFIAPPVYAEEIPADSEYLRETTEVAFSNDIIELADQLGGTPANLYEYVRNRYDYESYAGSVKGAEQTLFEKGGNEWDLASLLIALLRSQGIPARYAVGTVKIPIDRAMSWLQVDDPKMAGSLLASNGRPTTMYTQGGEISSIATRHVWVQAYVPFLASGGVDAGPGDTWVNVDPSFKEHSISTILSVDGKPDFDFDGYLSTFQEESPYDYYHAQIDGFLNSTGYANYRPEALQRKSEIVPEWFGVLIGQLPYTSYAVEATYSEVPDAYRQTFSLSLIDDSTGETLISYDAPMAGVLGRRLTLSYEPATDEDRDIINAYGTVYDVPAYLLMLKPVLKIDGATVAEGAAIGSGSEQTLAFVFDNTMEKGRVENKIQAGEYYAIGLSAQASIDRQQIMERTAALSDLAGTIDLNDYATLDDRLGELLYLTAMVYHQNLGFGIKDAREFSNVIDVRQVSEIMYFLEAEVDNVYGVPYSLTPIGVSGDMDRDIHLVVPADGDMTRIKPYMKLVGAVSSFLEHHVTESIYGFEAISSVKAIQLAHDMGISVYTLTPDNAAGLLPGMTLSDQVKADIQSAVNAGKEVVVPESDLTVQDWTGLGYIVMDPTTGAGAYLISGGLGGAAEITASSYLNLWEGDLAEFSANADATTMRPRVCYPGRFHFLGEVENVCYTVVEWGDIKDACGEEDPECKNKYGFWAGTGRFASPLIDVQENSTDTYLTDYVTAWDWQSQDGARYMRAGLGAMKTVDYLMIMLDAKTHNLNPDGSGYRTVARTQYLVRNKNNKRPSMTSHHMEGVAADVVLKDANGEHIDKCEVMKTTSRLIEQGELLHEGTVNSVHFATRTTDHRDFGACRYIWIW